MKSASRWLTITRFSLYHWLYTQNGLNLFSRWQHSKNMLTKRERRSFFFFASIYLKNSKKIHPTFIFGCKKGCKSRNYLIYTLFCGEGGIRTPGTSQYVGFQDRCNRPLCHLSKSVYFVAEMWSLCLTSAKV